MCSVQLSCLRHICLTLIVALNTLIYSNVEAPGGSLKQGLLSFQTEIHLKPRGVRGILILARTEFCQAQFKVGLTELSVAMYINWLPIGLHILERKTNQEETISINFFYKDRKGK